MKLLKKSIIAFIAFCVLAVGATAVEPQKDGQKPPPPKEKQEVPKPDKTPPPPPRDNGNRGSGDKKGKP